MTNKMITKFWWAIVVIAALSISTWSLYWLGRHVGMPAPLAAVVSMAFDGGAIAASDLSLKWARIHGISGMSARMAMLSFGGLSAYFNYNHAVLAGLPYIARWLFAAPPIIALTTIELHLRFEYRNSLKRSGNLPSELPHYAKWAWFFRPVKTFKAMLWYIDRQIDDSMGNGIGEFNGEVSHRIIRAWAIQEGRDVPKRGLVPSSIVKEYMARELPRGNDDGNAA